MGGRGTADATSGDGAYAVETPKPFLSRWHANTKLYDIRESGAVSNATYFFTLSSASLIKWRKDDSGGINRPVWYVLAS